MKLKNYAMLATAILVTVLTSCATNSSPNVKNLNIFQPSTLRLKANQRVETIDGFYTPQTDEVWHSDARFRRIEREIYSK